MNRRFVLVALGLAVVSAGLFAVLRPGDRFAACRGGGGGAVGADIGGPFELVDQDGRAVTDADLIDRPTLIYFGYTFCPDFCPTDTANMALAADLLAERGLSIRTVFVTIDPARDTPERMKAFVRNLHPEMVGLTGSPEAIAAAARAYRVYYARADEDPEFYIMDHSTFTYLMAPGAGLLDFFRHATPPEEMAERIACYAAALD